jgi:lysozyme
MNGIDVSHNNGVIDWAKVSKNTTKVDFAFIKATEGVGYTDSSFMLNANEAKKNGIKIGYYHFASLNTTNNVADAKAEVNYFVSVIKKAPAADLPLILDLETNKVGLDKTQVLEWINTFFSEMKKLGYDNLALYSYTPFLDSNLPPKHLLGTIKLWIAAYVNTATPKLPKGWKEYWIWQYSSKGTVLGIKGNVDLNKTKIPIFS